VGIKRGARWGEFRTETEGEGFAQRTAEGLKRTEEGKGGFHTEARRCGGLKGSFAQRTAEGLKRTEEGKGRVSHGGSEARPSVALQFSV